MKWFLGLTAATALLTAACSSTFVATKDGRGYFLGSGSSEAYKLFCASGDLKHILEDTRLSGEVKNELFQYNCGAERSKEKVRQVYASMTPEQRKDLRSAFKRNGYDVNYMHC
jgi:hypothetical protein